MALDAHRPVYHFVAGNWMNDPKPFFRRNGDYHVFFQHKPNREFAGPVHWGHTMSRDLVHWTALPIALSPTPGGPDQDGCWTGCVVGQRTAGEGERFHILYTGIPRLTPLQQNQCLAGSDDLIAWEKYPGNPVIAEQPEGFGECFRDPCAWREGEKWRMVIGSQVDGQGGAALLYESTDLTDWSYLGPLFVGTIEETGVDFECPDFFPLADGHVLIASRGKTFWHVGQYEGDRFVRERWGVTDGGSFYAAKTLLDGSGRRILFGWILETRPGEEQKKAGWSGALSLPRVLTLLPDRSLGIEPVRELEALRGERHHFEDLSLQGDGESETLLLEGVRGDALEIEVRFAPTGAQSYGVAVRCSTDLAEGTEIGYDRGTERLVGAPLRLRHDEGLTLRIYVDRSVIEAFANGRACHTLRAYPEREDCLGVALFARGGSVHVRSVDVWEMKSIGE